MPRVFSFSDLSLSALDLLELSCRIGALVKIVQRIATRRQAVARRGSAVTERPAHTLASQRAAFQDVAWQIRIRQNHSSEPDAIHPAFPQRCLRDVGQKILQ